MIKRVFGERLDGWIRRLFPFLFRRRLNPNLLTVLGTLISLGSAACFARGQLVWGGMVLLVGGFFDLVDGVVARHQGRTTAFGGFLDSTLDRLADVAVLVGLVIHYQAGGDGLHAVVAGAALAGSVLTSYAKARADLVVDSVNVGLLERGERVALIAAGALFGWMELALWLVAIGSWITVGQRILVAYREMQRLEGPGGTGGRGDASLARGEAT